MFKINMLPLISWRSILFLIFKKPIQNFKLAEPWLSNQKHNYYWLYKSSYALKLIVKWWIAYTKKKTPKIWIPNYFCNDSLNLLRKEDCRIIFYPIDENLNPKWDSFSSLIKNHPPDIFILVHYFGFASEIKKTRSFCDDHKIIFIEDATHVLKPNNGIGEKGDFILYSPHKHLAIPDGSLLIQKSKKKFVNIKSNKSPGEILQLVIQEEPKIAKSPKLWLFKQILKKLKLAKNITFQSFSSKKNTISNEKIYSEQSIISKKLLSFELSKLDDYIRKRNINLQLVNNFLNLHSFHFISGDDGNKSFKNNKELKNTIPYLAAIQKTNKILNKGFEQNFMIWPGLPPEILNSYNNNDLDIIKLEKKLRFFPIHQGLKAKSLFPYLLSQTRENYNRSSLILEWFNGSCNDWKKHQSMFDKISLMQTWEYGETKSLLENWKVKRAIIKLNGEIISMFQVLEKSIGFLKICRINRGPLIKRNKVTLNIKLDIYKLIKNKYNLFNFRILFISPSFNDEPINKLPLILSNFKKRKIGNWCTAYVNLYLDELSLRKKLKSKWRNQLKKSESENINISISQSKDDFNLLMRNYGKMMIKLSFKSTPVSFYDKLYSFMNEIYIINAHFDNSIIASIMIIKFGKNCVYQIGWSNKKGKHLNAHNLLLWNAIIKMKEKGCEWFDLGGINELTTPGVAKFKKDIGGDHFKSVGEWINFS